MRIENRKTGIANSNIQGELRMNKGSYQRRLIIDRNQNTNETLRDFPIQIHIQNLLLRSVAAGGKVLDADGADIAFYASDDQTRLAATIKPTIHIRAPSRPG